MAWRAVARAHASARPFWAEAGRRYSYLKSKSSAELLQCTIHNVDEGESLKDLPFFKTTGTTTCRKIDLDLDLLVCCTRPFIVMRYFLHFVLTKGMLKAFNVYATYV